MRSHAVCLLRIRTGGFWNVFSFLHSVQHRLTRLHLYGTFPQRKWLHLRNGKRSLGTWVMWRRNKLHAVRKFALRLLYGFLPLIHLPAWDILSNFTLASTLASASPPPPFPQGFPSDLNYQLLKCTYLSLFICPQKSIHWLHVAPWFNPFISFLPPAGAFPCPSLKGLEKILTLDPHNKGLCNLPAVWFFHFWSWTLKY